MGLTTKRLNMSIFHQISYVFKYKVYFVVQRCYGNVRVRFSQKMWIEKDNFLDLIIKLPLDGKQSETLTRIHLVILEY